MTLKNINSIIQDVIKNNNWEQQTLVLKEAIKEELDNIASNLTIEKITEEVLVIGVNTSGLLMELSFQKYELIKRINNIKLKFGNNKRLRDIKFIIRKRR